MTEPVVRLERPTEGVVVVTLDRPDQRNALGWQAWADLNEALTRVRDDDTARVLVLTGEGGCFSAGGDVKSSPERGQGVAAPAARLSEAHRAVTTLSRLPIPTIAAVEGFAVGVGWSLVLACDLVVAAEDAFFAAPFVQRGLIPDGGMALLLTRAVGRQHALALLMLGERVPAPEAASMRLVNRLTAPGEALDTALDLADRLRSGAPDALMLTKRMVRAADPDLDRFLDAEWLAVALALQGEEAAEGRSAFAEKRSPDFTRRRP